MFCLVSKDELDQVTQEVVYIAGAWEQKHCNLEVVLTCVVFSHSM
jgi:hypothetical protein